MYIIEISEHSKLKILLSIDTFNVLAIFMRTAEGISYDAATILSYS